MPSGIIRLLFFPPSPSPSPLTGCEKRKQIVVVSDRFPRTKIDALYYGTNRMQVCTVLGQDRGMMTMDDLDLALFSIEFA